VIALALLAATAGGASAQMVFDGNLLYLNNASGTLIGQFSGTAGAGAPACAPGFTAGQLGTVTYVNNVYADPLLPNAAYQANVVPNFQPGAGSPAFLSAVTVPNDGFFEQVCFRGAIGPNIGDDWTQGWTYYDSTGANRQDLHLVSMPDPRPLALYDNINIVSHQYWGPDSNYLVRGKLRVKSQASLNIAPGVVILEEKATLGTIIVERGGKLYAIGNECEPIIITSDQGPGLQARGDIGGIYMLGYGKTHIVDSCLGDSAAVEGGAIGYYGGNDDNDGSGVLRYVRVEYAGKEITPNNELNSFTFGGVGRNTKMEYCQAFHGADDGFEWFGGTMDAKYLVAIDGTDDGYDWQWGARNRAQFVVVRVSSQFAPSLGQSGDKGIEADNAEPPVSLDQVRCSGRSFCQLANVTFVGDRRFGASFPGPTSGVNWRRGTGGTMLNSIIYNFKTAALKIDDDATFQAHCVAPPAAPAVFCGPGGTVGVQPITTGTTFVARTSPNPFRNQVALTFALPEAGPVSVEIYSADGRHVQTLAQGEMGAGQHTLTWNLDGSTPSGVYFYRVMAGDRQSTGKITRLD
jgi:hypothetical protein